MRRKHGQGMKRQLNLCELDLCMLKDCQMATCDVRSGQRLVWDQRSLTHIFPAQSGLAVLAVDVSNSMKACQQHSLLGWPAAHVHPVGIWGQSQGGSDHHKGPCLSNCVCP